MKENISSVSAASLEWQKKCWELAIAGKAFTVSRSSEKNLPFIEALAAAYQYKFDIKRKLVIFTPPTPSTGQEISTMNKDVAGSGIVRERRTRFVFMWERLFKPSQRPMQE